LGVSWEYKERIIKKFIRNSKKIYISGDGAKACWYNSQCNCQFLRWTWDLLRNEFSKKISKGFLRFKEDAGNRPGDPQA